MGRWVWFIVIQDKMLVSDLVHAALSALLSYFQEWPDNDFRIFVGDIGNEVNDDVLAKAFQRYPSFAKAKVTTVDCTRTGTPCSRCCFCCSWDKHSGNSLVCHRDIKLLCSGVIHVAA